MAQLHKNIGFAGLGQFIYTLLAFALIPFASRYLGEEGFGIYSLATAIGFFVSLFTDLGMSTLLTRESSRRKILAEPLFACFLGIKSALVIVTLALLLVYLQIGGIEKVAFHSIIIFSLSSIISSYAQNAFSVFRAFEKIQYETLGVAVDKLFSVFIGIIFLVMGYDIRIFISSFLIASIIKLLLSFILLEKKFIRIRYSFKFKRAVPLLYASIPFGLSVLLAVCYNYLAILMLSVMTNFKDVGWYSGSYKFLNLTTLIPQVLSAAFLPQLSVCFNNYKKLTELFLKGCQYLFIFSIPMIPVILLMARWIVLTFLGSKFEGSIISLRILVFAAFAQMLNSFFVSLYAAINKQKKILYFQIVGLLFNLTLNVILIPIVSYRGAAIATIVTEWSILLLITIWAARNIFQATPEWKALIYYVLRLVLATTILSIVIVVMQYAQVNNVLIVGCGGMTYVLCLQMLKCVDFLALSRRIFEFIR
ncbi:MAG TPA: flippase [bacterium]|nr:flippase [bacterium]HPN44936.1 flippase [bacterium]